MLHNSILAVTVKYGDDRLDTSDEPVIRPPLLPMTTVGGVRFSHLFALSSERGRRRAPVG